MFLSSVLFGISSLNVRQNSSLQTCEPKIFFVGRFLSTKSISLIGIFFKCVYVFIFGWVGSLSLHRLFSSCSTRGLSLVVRGLLITAASLVATTKLWNTSSGVAAECTADPASVAAAPVRRSLLLGTWDLPRSGIELVSPALAGELVTTEPPGKPHEPYFFKGSFWMSFGSSCLSGNLSVSSQLSHVLE